jgi:ABC-type Mn2+/Zn2+ transport system ATPase subunit
VHRYDLPAAVVVLDEPTTGLDLVTQKITLDLLARLRDELNTAMVYVTHDLSVLGQIATHGECFTPVVSSRPAGCTRFWLIRCTPIRVA